MAIFFIILAFLLLSQLPKFLSARQESIRLEKKKEELRLEKARKVRIEFLNPSCKHGVAGAKNHIQLCPKCLTDHSIKLEKDANLLRLDNKREESRIQRIKDIERINSEQLREDRRLSKAISSYDTEKIIELVDINFLRVIDPKEFEIFTSNIFRAKGYKSNNTTYSGDFGIDVFLEKENELILVQCKRNNISNRVGRPVVQQLFGNIHDYKMKNPNNIEVSGMIVTTSSLTKEAEEWLKDKPIKIIDSISLIKIFKEVVHLKNPLFDEYVISLFQNYEIDEELVRNNLLSQIPKSLCPKCSDIVKTSITKKIYRTWCINPNCDYEPVFYKFDREKHKKSYRKYY